MTRRERLDRIIENFGGIYGNTGRFHLQTILARRGLAALTDEATEALAWEIVNSHKRQQRWNREYRAKRGA